MVNHVVGRAHWPNGPLEQVGPVERWLLERSTNSRK